MIKTFFNAEKPLYKELNEEEMTSPSLSIIENNDDLDILGDNLSSQVDDIVLGASCISDDSCLGKLCTTDCPSDCKPDLCSPVDYNCMSKHNIVTAVTCRFDDIRVPSNPVTTGDTSNSCLFVSGTCYSYSSNRPANAKFQYTFNYYPIKLYGLPSVLNKCYIPYEINNDVLSYETLIRPFYNIELPKYVASGVTNDNKHYDLISLGDAKYIAIDFRNRGGNSKYDNKNEDIFKLLVPGHLVKSGVTISACTYAISLASGETKTKDELIDLIINKAKTNSASTEVFMKTASFSISCATQSVLPEHIKYNGIRYHFYNKEKYNNGDYINEDRFFDESFKTTEKYNILPYNQISKFTYSTDGGKTSKFSNSVNSKMVIYNPYKMLTIQPTRAGFEFTQLDINTWGASSAAYFTSKSHNTYDIFSQIESYPTNQLLTGHEFRKIYNMTTVLNLIQGLNSDMLINAYETGLALNTSNNTFAGMCLSGMTYDSASIRSNQKIINASHLLSCSSLGFTFYTVNNTSASTIDCPKSSLHCVFEKESTKVDIGPFSNLGQNIWYANRVEKDGKVKAENWIDNRINTYFMNMSSIGAWGFSEYPNLKKCYISKDITSIGDGAFYDDSNCILYYFIDHTAVPTLSSTRTFQNMNSSCKIVVPDSLYDSWKAATNWSTFASKIVKKSEYNDL